MKASCRQGRDHSDEACEGRLVFVALFLTLLVGVPLAGLPEGPGKMFTPSLAQVVGSWDELWTERYTFRVEPQKRQRLKARERELLGKR